MKELEEEDERIAGERDATRAEAKQEASTAQTLPGELDTLQTAYQQQQGVLPEAKTAIETSQNVAQQWRQDAEGNSSFA